MSYIATPGTDGEIQRIYVAFTLDSSNNAEVWKVQYKTGKESLLNLVNPYTLKFDTDRNAVKKAQFLLKKKNPRTTICTIM
jgi:hypothetical protein